jgi:hypothetical protein
MQKTWRGTLVAGVVLLVLFTSAAVVIAVATDTTPWLVVIAGAGPPLGLIVGSLIRGLILKK